MCELKKYIYILSCPRGKPHSWKNGTVVGIITVPLLDERIIFSNDLCLCRTCPLYTAKGIRANPASSSKDIDRICFTAELSQITCYSVYFSYSCHKNQESYCSLQYLFIQVPTAENKQRGASGELCHTDQTQSSRRGSWDTRSSMSAQAISMAWGISNDQCWITVSLNNFPEVMGSVCS